jgi:hypothetical protein
MTASFGAMGVTRVRCTPSAAVIPMREFTTLL